jgi:adenylate cyclase
MLSFPSARAAVLAAMAMQRELAVYSAEHPATAIKIRIGAHTGEAIVDAEGDLFGKHIILAARIANISDGGQILVSTITREIASSRGDLPFGEAREVTLKGLEGVHHVFEVKWNEYQVVSS